MKKITELNKGDLFYYGVHRDSNGEFEYRLQEFHALTTEADSLGEGDGMVVWSHNKEGSTDLTIYDSDASVLTPQYRSMEEAFDRLNKLQTGVLEMSEHEVKLLLAFTNWFK